MEWTKDATIRLVELFREKPELWDTSGSSYRDKAKKQIAWNEIAMTMGVGVKEVEKKMRVLIGQFQREEKKVMSRYGYGKPKDSKWFCYNHLYFIRGRYKPRQNLGDTSNFQVYLRIRPPIESSFIKIVDKQTVHVNKKVRQNDDEIVSFNFSKIFDNASQEDIFNECIRKRVLGFLNGQSTVFMTYGSSGSGKTYTLHGTKSNPGVITRYLEYIFSTFENIEELPKLKPYMNYGALELTPWQSQAEYCNKLKLISDVTNDEFSHMAHQLNLSSRVVTEMSDYFSIWISFVEIYNEHVYDLLGNTKKSLKIKKNSINELYIEGVNLVTVSNSRQAYQLMMYGMKNLRYASTKINKHSSRSHSLFTVYLVQKWIEQDEEGTAASKISKMTFCDLAGCERANDSKNVGTRLVESKNINKSLFVLKRCFDALLKQKNRLDGCIIPYRDSKLTMLLHEALVGKESLTLIVNISSECSYHSITLNTLEFSSVAKQVISATKRHQEEKLALAQVPEEHKLALTQSSKDSVSSNNCETSVDAMWKKLTHQEVRYLFLQNQNLKAKLRELEEKREQVRIEHNERIDRLLKGYSELGERRINHIKERETEKNNEIIEKMRNKFIEQQDELKKHIQTLEHIKAHQKKSKFTIGLA